MPCSIPLTEPKARLAASGPIDSLVFAHHSTGVTGMDCVSAQDLNSAPRTFTASTLIHSTEPSLQSYFPFFLLF